MSGTYDTATTAGTQSAMAAGDERAAVAVATQVRTGLPWRARRERGRSPASQIELSRVVCGSSASGTLPATCNRCRGTSGVCRRCRRRKSRGARSRPFAGSPIADGVALKLYPKTGGRPAGRLRRLRRRAGARCRSATGRRSSPVIPRCLWRTRLIERADRVVAHRLTFFDLDRREPRRSDRLEPRVCERARPTPRGFAEAIDYRDYAVTGDCKVVWEPNRHHQLVILGRAYRATGDARYARAVVEQIDSWIEQCPFGYGHELAQPARTRAFASSTGPGRST